MLCVEFCLFITMLQFWKQQFTTKPLLYNFPLISVGLCSDSLFPWPPDCCVLSMAMMGIVNQCGV